MFNIRNMIDSVSKDGTLPTNRFLIYFASPPVMRGVVDGANATASGMNSEQLIQLRAEQASIPGVQLMTTDNFRYGVGPPQKMPYTASFTEMSVVFLLDRNGIIYNYFYGWLRSIFDFSGSSSVSGGMNTNPSYKTEYKDYYSTDLVVMVSDAYEDATHVYTMKKAFPIAVTAIPVNWNQQNELMKMTVQFTFRDWSLDDTQVIGNAVPNTPVSDSSTYNVLSQGSGFASPTQRS